MKLKTRLEKLESRTFFTKALKNRITLASDRLQAAEMSEPDFKGCVDDIFRNFPKAHASDVLLAIEKGSMGKYGVHHKLSIQVIGYWINSYLKEEENKNKGKL